MTNYICNNTILAIKKNVLNDCGVPIFYLVIRKHI